MDEISRRTPWLDVDLRTWKGRYFQKQNEVESLQEEISQLKTENERLEAQIGNLQEGA